MKKLFIAFAILSTTVYITADWNKGQWDHEDKADFKKSPQEMAHLINYLKKQTIMQPPELMKQWNDLRADAIKAAAGEIVRQIIPQIDCPIKRAHYKKLVTNMVNLAQQVKNLPLPDRPFKVSLDNLPQLLALKGRLFALGAQQLTVIAKQTGTKILFKKAQHHLKQAQKIKQILQSLDHDMFKYDKQATMKAGMKTNMYDNYSFDYEDDNDDTDKSIYLIIEDDQF